MKGKKEGVKYSTENEAYKQVENMWPIGIALFIIVVVLVVVSM